MTKKEVLDLKPAPRLEQIGDKCSKQVHDRKHRIGRWSDSPSQRESYRIEFSGTTSHLFFLRFLFLFLFTPIFVLCCGGLFATTSTARSKRAHASGCNSGSLGFAMTNRTKITVTKIDAAKRQLRTAIRLWFEDGDPVSIHALAFAAYEIAHVVSKKRNRARRELIFDTLMVKDGYRADWNKNIKKHANFFQTRQKGLG
jgi:hypothetical protein